MLLYLLGLPITDLPSYFLTNSPKTISELRTYVGIQVRHLSNIEEILSRT
jgi:hypothetical protein